MGLKPKTIPKVVIIDLSTSEVYHTIDILVGGKLEAERVKRGVDVNLDHEHYISKVQMPEEE
jgi:hypothetical protein